MVGQPKISPITSSKTIHFSFRPKKNNYFSSNNIPTRGLTDSQTPVRAEAFISKTRGVFTKQSIKAVAGLTISVIKVIVANSLETMNNLPLCGSSAELPQFAPPLWPGAVP